MLLEPCIVVPRAENGDLWCLAHCISFRHLAFVGDLSSHLAGIFFYFLFEYLLLHETGKGDGVFSLRTCLELSAILGLLTGYPSAGYGAAVFFSNLPYHREWSKSLLPIVTMLLFPRLQLALVTFFGGVYGRDTEFL